MKVDCTVPCSTIVGGTTGFIATGIIGVSCTRSLDIDNRVLQTRTIVIIEFAQRVIDILKVLWKQWV